MGRKKETESTCEGKDQRKDWLDKCKNKRKDNRVKKNKKVQIVLGT